MSEHLIVVAIDFGTTYSGYAFSLGVEFETQPTKISSNKPWTASQGLVSHKAPTSILLKPDKSFYKFGYEAEDKYNDLAQSEAEDFRDYYYFRRFKMMLHARKNLQRETVIEDETGKQLKAKTVFSYGIKYLKDHAMTTIDRQGQVLDEMDIHWVITVPAIWSDAAKQFMREAAYAAGIESNNLSIALEPEAASVYCKYLPTDQLAGSDRDTSLFNPGSKYMVIDLGGGTADITVHRVEDDESLCEVHSPSGGAWGGTSVDEKFIKYLKGIVGEDVMKLFFKHHMEDVLDLYREFEIRKRRVKIDMSETPTLSIKIPVALLDRYQKYTGNSLRDIIKDDPKYKGKVTCLADKIRIDSSTMKSFFADAMENLVDHIREILAEIPVRGTNMFILVGGFSESEFVQETIRAKFPNVKTIVPFDAGLAVLKGAVIFGHAPMVITSRVCRRTFGIAVRRPFDKQTDPIEKHDWVGDREVCKDVFHKYMEIGQPLKVGEPVTTSLSASPHQTTARIRVYASAEKQPGFVTDAKSSYLGEVVVSLEDSDSVSVVDVKLTFGGTELAVETKERSTGKTVKSRFDFLRE